MQGNFNLLFQEKCKQIIQMTEGENFTGTFCSTCLIIRPIRSKHCRHCDKCIKKFDHHCIWIGQCVGQDNHRLFLLYLILLHLSTFVVIIGCLFCKFHWLWTNLSLQITLILDFSYTCGEVSINVFIHCQTWVSYTLIMAFILFAWLNCLIIMQLYGVSVLKFVYYSKEN